jgi:hypothetical protein
MARKVLDQTLNADLGKQLANLNEMLEELYDAPSAPGADFTDLAVATADGTDAATTQALANALKAAFNDLLDRLSGV